MKNKGGKWIFLKRINKHNYNYVYILLVKTNAISFIKKKNCHKAHFIKINKHNLVHSSYTACPRDTILT